LYELSRTPCRVYGGPANRKRRPTAIYGKIGGVTESKGGAHARRRRRGSSRQGPPPHPAPVEAPVAAQPPAPPAPPAPKRPRPPRQTREPGERGLADLVGGGRSQLGVSGALRGRDVNRPTEDDIAEAERDVVIVRRNWKPAP
jgi:hypothetical protein